MRPISALWSATALSAVLVGSDFCAVGHVSGLLILLSVDSRCVLPVLSVDSGEEGV